MKKVISVILSLMIIMTLAAPAASAAADTCTCGKAPVVYVTDESTVYVDPTATEPVPAINVNQAELQQSLKNAWRSLAIGVLLDQWDAFSDDVYNAIVPYYENYSLNKDGEIANHSGIAWSWRASELKDHHKQSGTDGIYYYYYDARLDPFEIAIDLNEYIKTVKAVTGHQKVNLIAEGIGSNIALTYLYNYQYSYNYSGIESFVIYSGCMNGVALYGQLFSGKLVVDKDAVNRYTKDNLNDEGTNSIIKTTVSLLSYTGFLDVGLDAFNYVYGKLYQELLPRILKSTFANNPGYWSMISNTDYEDAKELLLTSEAAKYATLINKLDRYHYTIQTNVSTIMDGLKNAGVKLGVVCKYGYQLPPIIQDSNLISDGTVELKSQSFNATCAPIGATLDAASLNKQYASPDSNIDASTCLLADSTWFIKNVHHDASPACVNDLLLSICASKNQMTVKDSESYPQYMSYDSGTGKLTAQTASAEEDGVSNWFSTVSANIKSFIAKVFNILMDIISGLIKGAN